MKKFAAMVLAATMCFSVAGCGGSQTEVEKIVVPDNAEKLFSGDDVYFEFDDTNKLTFYFTSDKLEIADCFYTVSYAVFELGKNDAEYELSIVLLDGTYELDLEAKEIDEMGFPDKWIEFVEESGIVDGTHTIQEMISKSAADTIEKEIDEKIVNELKDRQKEKIIAKKDYEVDGQTVSISLTEESGKQKLEFNGSANTEEKAYLLTSAFVVEMNSFDDEFYSLLVNVRCDNQFVLYQSNNYGKVIIVSGTNRDGTFVMDIPDWISDKNMETLNIEPEDLESYVIEIETGIRDFGEMIGYDMGKLLE